MAEIEEERRNDIFFIYEHQFTQDLETQDGRKGSN